MENTVSEGVDEAQSIHNEPNSKSKKKYVVIVAFVLLVLIAVVYLLSGKVGLNPFSTRPRYSDYFVHDVGDSVELKYIRRAKLIGVEGKMARVSDDQEGPLFIVFDEDASVYFLKDGVVSEKANADSLLNVDVDSNVGYILRGENVHPKVMNILFKDRVYPDSSVYEPDIVQTFYVF